MAFPPQFSRRSHGWGDGTAGPGLATQWGMSIDPLTTDDALARLTRSTLLDRLSSVLTLAVRRSIADLSTVDVALAAYVTNLKRQGGRPEHAIVHVRDAARRAAEAERVTHHPEWSDPEMFVAHVERRCFRAYFRAD